jgi:hypothetical protein
LKSATAEGNAGSVLKTERNHPPLRMAADTSRSDARVLRPSISKARFLMVSLESFESRDHDFA